MADKKILIVYTGGTFGMDPSPLKIPDLSPELLRKRILTHVPELEKLARCEVDVAMNRDSAHVGPSDWIALADRVRKAWKKYDGVVILHGTDTLAYTASALSFLLRPCLKPVILTGAQRPLAAIRTDARSNLISAVEIAAQARASVAKQVSIYFDDRLLQGNRARKRSALEFAAFECPKAEPLAVVGTSIRYRETGAESGRGVRKALAKVAGLELQPKFSERVATLHVTPGFPSHAFDERFFASIDALVLVVFPSGTAPTHDLKFIEMLKLARKNQVPVVVVTEGVGSHSSEYAAGKILLKEGCHWAGAMTPECAFVKASLLMGQPAALQAFSRLWRVDLAEEGAGSTA